MLLTINETARRLSCSRDTVERRIASGALRAFRDGGVVRVDELDLARYVQAGKRTPGGEREQAVRPECPDVPFEGPSAGQLRGFHAKCATLDRLRHTPNGTTKRWILAPLDVTSSAAVSSLEMSSLLEQLDVHIAEAEEAP